MTNETISNLIKEKEEQIKKLQCEINELKQKLIKNSNEEKSIFTLEQKLEIFMDYFKGRDDIYPYLSINKNDPNVKYYIPACMNEWRNGICNKIMGKQCKTCQYRENKPITRDTIKNHIYDNKMIGIYSMLEDETCYFLAFDFDGKKDENHVKEDVLTFAKICDDYHVPIAIEKSRLEKGIHCWLFFKDKIKAMTARKLGSLLLSKTMKIRDSLKLNSKSLIL